MITKGMHLGINGQTSNMLHLFNTQAFYLNRPINFAVSKISTNLYLADCNNQTIKRFTVKKVDGKWISDNEMTQFITASIGREIHKIENNKMRKINDFVRSCFLPSSSKEASQPATTMIQNLARI